MGNARADPAQSSGRSVPSPEMLSVHRPLLQLPFLESFLEDGLDEFETRPVAKCKSSGKLFSYIFFPKLTGAWLEELDEEGGVHSTSVSELLVILNC